MPWCVNHDAKLPFLETRYSGVLTPAELSAAVQATINMVRTHELYQLLGDCTALEGGHSVFDLYALVDVLLATGLAHRIKEAIVLPTLPMATEKVEFWELACMNRGVQVRIFTDRQSAIAWLAQ